MGMIVNSANWSAIASCLAYSVASGSMILVNKAISLSAVEVKTGDFLFIATQCFVASLLVEIARRCGKVTYDVKLSTVVCWLPVNFTFIFMLLTSFMAMKTCSVPVITVFKNLTNVLIVFADWHFNSQPISLLILMSLAVMCGGAVLASKNDIEFSMTGYIWMSLNCIATASYVLVMKNATKNVKIERAGMVFLNNFASFIMLFMLSVVNGEPVALTEGGQMGLPLLFLVTFSGILGVFLSFGTLWCVGSTSATTYAIVGTLNKVPTTIWGAMLFHSKVTASGALYIAVVLMGGFLYSWAKIQESSSKEKSSYNNAEKKSDTGSSVLLASHHKHDSHNSQDSNNV